MSPASFTTSPSIQGEQRKFINPTPGYVGANVFGPDGKPTAIAVEPGGEVWLTEAEERMTAEAPRAAADNPFIREWDEPVEWNSEGTEVIRTVRRSGTLVLVDEAPRPVASQRFIPDRQVNGTPELVEQPPAVAEEPAKSDRSPAPSEQETVKGADVPPAQPPVQGQPSEGEIVGTPEAPEQNAAAVSARASTAEQPVIDEEPLGI